jgi:hypothetical protein
MRGGLVSDTTHRTHWQLNTKLRTIDNDKDLVSKFGHSTLGHIAPHGTIGQSFDGSSIAVGGKVDKYGFGLEMTTSAQAEGAIEGVFTDHKVDSPFSTTFKYSHFDVHSHVAPRNVSLLAGAKAAATTGDLSASAVELHGTDAAPKKPSPARVTKMPRIKRKRQDAAAPSSDLIAWANAQ